MTPAPRLITLRLPEARTLATKGSVEVVRAAKMPPCNVPGAYFDAYNGGPEWCWWTSDNRQCNAHGVIRCPFGRVGDVVGCREAYYADLRDPLTGRNPAIIYASTPEFAKERMGASVIRCKCPDETCPTREECEANLIGHRYQRLQPASTMPRWAVRLYPVVASVAIRRRERWEWVVGLEVKS